MRIGFCLFLICFLGAAWVGWRVFGTFRWAVSETIVWTVDRQCENFRIPASETKRLVALVSGKAAGVRAGDISMLSGIELVRCLQHGAGHGALLIGGVSRHILQGDSPRVIAERLSLLRCFLRALRAGKISDAVIASVEAQVTAPGDVLIKRSSGLSFHEITPVMKSTLNEENQVAMLDLCTGALGSGEARLTPGGTDSFPIAEIVTGSPSGESAPEDVSASLSIDLFLDIEEVVASWAAHLTSQQSLNRM